MRLFLLDLPATAEVARAVYGTTSIDEPRLATALGLSRHTVRLTLADLQRAGALTMSVARDGQRRITVLLRPSTGPVLASCSHRAAVVQSDRLRPLLLGRAGE